ncbi:XYPPX repeat family protein [Histomonas meleagridis]|uniref:XYPPX repeat family protein n=1 Tax=Histomonas meleagridis TaxID=135588 RepID=UPI00355A2F44|nr:XYPPX repeat family protein [Histomonas meleagridis]KAH0798413.1 XYPPX repeat family protein [Histomonas meleagridis]
MPESPVWESFKRAMTTSFGSEACAAFWLAIAQACRAVINLNDNNNQYLAILRLIALCILCIIECCLQWINRYALIYCSLFGVPFREGCRRFMELSCNKFADVLFEGSIISLSKTLHLIVFTLAGLAVGFGIGYAMDDVYDWVFATSCMFALFFTFSIFLIVDFPFEGMTDTLFICFVEAPEKLKTSASELYERMKNSFSDSMYKKLH